MPIKLPVLHYMHFSIKHLNYLGMESKVLSNDSTFQYWNTILSIALLILIFMRAHREKNFPLYVEVLESIVGYFFVFDRY